MAASSSSDQLTEIEFEHKWMIKNWKDVVENEAQIENTYTEILCEAENLEYATFLIGLKTPNEQPGFLRFKWTLVREPFCLHNVEANLSFEILRKNGLHWHQIKSHASPVIGKTAYVTDQSRLTLPTFRRFDLWTDDEGSLVIILKIRLTYSSDMVSLFKAENFRKSFKDELSQNLATMLNEKLNSDIKILTKDNIEFQSHKTILQARCPVFASMFGSDFSEKNTGKVIVDDISAKTMEILLKYWYSGELPASWEDNDDVAEFVYAAGKYQLNKVLEMLDEVLVRELKVSHVNMELLQIVHNLSLKNAESRLLKRLVHEISQATRGAHLLDLVSMDAQSIDENDLAAKEILKAFDDALSEQNDKECCTHHIKLLAMACKFEMKNVETKLLNCIIGLVNKVNSVDELFALFDLKNKTQDSRSSEFNLLVRAS